MDCLLDHQTAIFSAEGGTACKEEFDKNTNRGYT